MTNLLRGQREFNIPPPNNEIIFILYNSSPYLNVIHLTKVTHPLLENSIAFSQK